MVVEVITREDLQVFRSELLSDLRQLLSDSRPVVDKKWLRGKEVRKLLNISPGTLQNLRITGKLRFSKIGGILFYLSEDLEKMLQKNLV